MRRGGPLRRKTPLKANPEATIGWQRRSRKALNPVSMRARDRQPARAETRAKVLARDGGCVAAFIYNHHCSDTLDVHELKSRGRGGSITDEANCLTLCRTAHTKVTENPAWAESVGLLLPSWADDTLRAEAARVRGLRALGVDAHTAWSEPR